jgi:murein DD-endopeptidase MepM/ murein hydrolase activator NlpD
VVSEVKQDYEKFTRYATGTIESSLFQSAKRVGLSEKITAEMARIFGWDIDFALDIQPGDKFSVVYQSLYHDGQKIADGNILAAEFVTDGKSYRALRYTTPDGKSGYYSPDGNNLHKPFLRTPVHFSRISSPFGHRKHPVLNTMRLHKGVDYAAPRGTVVKASGKGKIIFRGTLRGYGKTVIIQHGKRYRTLYAHLQGYHSSQRMGSYVAQGAPIGYVGSSGLATGPHLHYEFLVNGVHRNPLDVKLPETTQLTEAHLQDFKNRASSMLNMLDMVSQSTLAMNVNGETRHL